MTTRRISMFVLLVILGIGSVTVRASSLPAIQGTVSGIELCPQYICGSAIFTGVFKGLVAGRPAFGFVSVAVTHDPLPDPGESASINSGVWTIQLLSGRKFGGIATGGSLFNNGNDTFQVSVDMLALSGATGTLTFAGLLSHQTFPPTIGGVIY